MGDAVQEMIVRHFEDLRFTVVAKVHSQRVEYAIYDIEGWEEGETPGKYDQPLWHKADSASSPNPVETLEESEVFLHGWVKWDGCSDWYFDNQEQGYMHGCCRKDVQRFGDIMGACWDWTAELCPKWMV